MGLNFAELLRPHQRTTRPPPPRACFGTVVSWLFIVVNGHLLLVIAALVQSFQAFPVGPEPFAFLRQAQPHRWGAEIFATGPVVSRCPWWRCCCSSTSVLGCIPAWRRRSTVFSVGFPVTIGVGLVGLLLTLPALQQPFVFALERLLATMR
jgi:flagellar biosynthetic protein FliR